MTAARAALKFEMMNAIAAELREDHDCAVRVVALAAGIPYTEARERLAREGRESGQPTHNHQWQKVLDDLEVVINKVSEISEDGKYIVTTETHMYLVINNTKIDYRVQGRKESIEDLYFLES